MDKIDAQLCSVIISTIHTSLTYFCPHETCALVWTESRGLYTNCTRHLYVFPRSLNPFCSMIIWEPHGSLCWTTSCCLIYDLVNSFHHCNCEEGTREPQYVSNYHPEVRSDTSEVDHSLFYRQSSQGCILYMWKTLLYVENVSIDKENTVQLKQSCSKVPNKISWTLEVLPWYKSCTIQGWFSHIKEKICPWC